ncbi:unnamed protein product [Oikopleura dioica]|uniref:Uncharacterized protein n=1 Tax=Oikopleura dioica TaxID=34765 RepID=E4X0D2_OIKDI|nr:unnamed protein product [Oikopleura dioica]
MEASFIFPICIMASTMMITEDFSTCSVLDDVESGVLFHLIFFTISYFGTIVMVIYKRMAGKRQETIPLLAGTGIPLTATGLALICAAYYVHVGHHCRDKENLQSTASGLPQSIMVQSLAKEERAEIMLRSLWLGLILVLCGGAFLGLLVCNWPQPLATGSKLGLSVIKFHFLRIGRQAI